MPNFEVAEFANEKENLISLYKAPNETEFLIHLQQLLKEYNGTLPGDSIPNFVVSEGFLIQIVLSTFAMGLATDPHRMLQYIKKPIGPLIGMVCQFGLMPCIAIAFISTVPIGTFEALVIILYGCAPGGGFSNIIVYYMGGDIDLSITMTMLSCVFALVFTPAWLQIIPLVVNSSDAIIIPYKEILVTLAAVVTCSLFGSFIHWLGKRYDFSRRLKIITQFMAATSVILFIAILIIAIYKFYPVAIVTQAQLVFSAILPFLGFTIAYALSSCVVWILKKMGKESGVKASQHLTIGVETAIQNGRMVNAITLALYKDMMFENAQTFFFPLLGTAWQAVFGITMAVIVRIPCINRIIKDGREKLQNEMNEEEEENKVNFES